MLINFHGVRGSYPCWGEGKQQVGGQTSCVSATLPGQDTPVIFDMGTGIIELGNDLVQEGVKNITVIVSHFHLDHVMGLPFFKPLWNPDVTITFYSPAPEGQMTLEQILREKLFCPPLFPIPFEKIPATCVFKTFGAGESMTLSGGATLDSLALNHPGTATGYRLRQSGKSFCYITDHEHTPDYKEGPLLDFVHGTDLMVFDTMFTPCDYAIHKDWGHSSWQAAVEVAQKASVKKLALFHVSPDYDDEMLLQIERDAQDQFPAAFLAREGTGVEI